MGTLERSEVRTKTLYIHKYEIWQAYGGPEEGSWYYDQGKPIADFYPLEVVLTRYKVVNGYDDNSGIDVWDDEPAYALCRKWNEAEYRRREEECKYGYTSVLSAADTFYTYTVEDYPWPTEYPVRRPHYE